MLVSVLCSGSEGNSTLVQIDGINILIDLGLNNKYICDQLHQLGLESSDINYLLITHGHKDHTGAMSTFLKKNNPLIFVNEKVLVDIPFLNDYDNISFENGLFNITDDVTVETFNLSHDAPGARGYIISDAKNSMVYITDTGYINSRLLNKITDKSVYVFESNHDIEMLLHGRYPSWLKKRILSDEGHLSNEQAGFYLSRIIGPDTKKVILAHLSHENNSPDVAVDTVKKSLIDNNISFNDIEVASQRERLDVIIND